MREPVYHYIKGEGWSIKEINVYPDKNGKSLICEFRQPNVGETYFRLSASYYWRNKNLDWDAVALHVRTFAYERFPVCNAFDKFTWTMTLVPA